VIITTVTENYLDLLAKQNDKFKSLMDKRIFKVAGLCKQRKDDMTCMNKEKSVKDVDILNAMETIKMFF